MTIKRKLTTILAADVVGYSRLVAKDEESALRSVSALIEEIITPAALQFNGRIVKLMGDGILMDFGSTVDAVRFALSVQQSLEEFNADIELDKRVVLRIGINIGDIVVEDNDIFGNGVNLASRLEVLCDPGGVCVSATVVDHVSGKVDACFKDLGKKQVKNIPKPIHVFSCSASTRDPERDISEARTHHRLRPDTSNIPGFDLSLPDSPSVAVLPFNNMSTDPEQEFFSDGISEDIITTLSKIPGLLVVARNSTFIYKNKPVDIKKVSLEQGVRYVLEGSVRKSANRVRVTAQLIDATTGHHVWAERYDRLLEDVFAVQDDITKEVVTAMDVHLSGGEQTVFWSAGTKSLEAWEQVRLGMDQIANGQSKGQSEALRYCNKAMELDPGYAMAWVLKGWTYNHSADVGVSYASEDVRDKALQSAIECGQKALQLDPDCADAYSLLGLSYLSLGQYEMALGAFGDAIRLAPGHSEILVLSGITYTKCGKPEAALEMIKSAMRRCPIYPTYYLWALGNAYRFSGYYDEAIAAFRAGTNSGSSFLSLHVNLASLYGELDMLEEAREPVSTILKINPDFSVTRYMAGLEYRNRKNLEQIEAGLLNAGLPA